MKGLGWEWKTVECGFGWEGEKFYVASILLFITDRDSYFCTYLFMTS